MLTRVLASWPAIVAIPLISAAWYTLGYSVNEFVFGISVAALTFSQLILRENDRDTKLLLSMNRAQIHVDNRIPNEVAEHDS